MSSEYLRIWNEITVVLLNLLSRHSLEEPSVRISGNFTVIAIGHFAATPVSSVVIQFSVKFVIHTPNHSGLASLKISYFYGIVCFSIGFTKVCHWLILTEFAFPQLISACAYVNNCRVQKCWLSATTTLNKFQKRTQFELNVENKLFRTLVGHCQW